MLLFFGEHSLLLLLLFSVDYLRVRECFCVCGVCVCVRVVFGRGAQFDFGLLTVQRVFESFHFQLAVDLLLQ